MGPNPSRVAKPAYENYNSFAGDREAIFEVSPDEQAFCLDFTSPLFSKRPEEVVKPFYLPNENTIVDIMADPVAFTQATTPCEVWQDVVAPLFSGVDDTKPYIHQLLNAYYKFLKERPIVFMDNEDNQIRELNEERQMETQSLAAAHSNYKNPQIEINDNLIKKLKLDSDDFQIGAILDIIPGNSQSFSGSNLAANSSEDKSSNDHLQSKNNQYLIPCYHPSYDQITSKVCQNVDDAFSAYVAIKWGLFAGDITPIFVALKYLIKKSQNERDFSKTPFHYYFNNFQSTIENFPLENSILFPHHKKLSHTTIINFKMPKTPSRSMMTCNGKYIYVLGGHSLLTIISLSKFVNNNEHRFRCYDFEIKKKKRIDAFIAISNGYLIVGGRFLDHEQIYNTQPFSKVEDTITYETNAFFRSSPKLVPPVACDGTYIYSLIKPKKLAVFSLSEKHIIFHRYIKLKKNGHELLDPFKHLVPKQWMDTANIYTNGVFFSFIVLKQSNQNRFEYFIRNFSLATGNHIKDLHLNLRWPIQSIIFDPWNDCLWALSPSKDDVNLTKMMTYGSMPPWMTGLSTELIDSEDDLKKFGEDLKNAKNATSVMNTLIDVFYYLGIHYSGALFDAIYTSPQLIYNVQMAQFLGSCTQLLFDTIIDLIQYLVDQVKTKPKHSDWSDQSKSEYALKMLFSILQYNLSNTEKRREVVAPKEETTGAIIDLMEKILNDNSLVFLYYNAAFLLFSCFNFLFQNRLTRCPTIFSLILSKIKRDDFIYYGLCRINDCHFLPYCISYENCRQIVEPIFEKMVTKPLEFQSKQFEFISLLQSSLMLEMRKVYLDHPSGLPPAKMQLQKAFFMYSKSFTERMINFIQIPNLQLIEKYIKYSSFFRLFRKWLMFLQPLAKFSRVSSTLVFYLHSLFTPFQTIITKISSRQLTDDGKDFSYTAKVFNELFSIYLDFISSLLNGGEELQSAGQYTWLVRSTLDSQMKPEIVNQMTETFLSESTSVNQKIKILSEKWTLDDDLEASNSNDSEDESSNSHPVQNMQKAVIELIANGLNPKETPSIKSLFDYLYTKVKVRAFNIKLNEKDRYLERLVFFAFMRQLGFSNEVVELNNDLLSDQQPVLSHFIRMSVEGIYRIRRETRAVKQSAIQNNDQQSLSDYLLNLKKKCIFLINIQPCIRFQQNDIDTIFPEFLKRIQTFLIGKLDINECFELIEEADNARKHISTGLKLVNDIIESKSMLDDLITFMLDRLSASESIMKYLSSLHFSTTDPSENTGFKNVMTLLNLLSKMIAEIPDPSVTNTLIIFYSNFILTISKINPDAIHKPLEDLLIHLIEKKKYISQQYFSSYMALVVSCVYAIFTESPHPSQASLFEMLKSILFPDKVLNESQLSVVRLCISAGMNLPYTSDTIISFIKFCKPSFYHPAFSLLFEVIRKSQQQKKIFMFILKEIAQICSGAFSSLLADSPTLVTATKDSKTVKTPGISLCACSDMIQICRRCLTSDGECKKILISIIRYILKRGKWQNDDNVEDKDKDLDETKDSDLKVFRNQIYLFAVFAILSNAIDIFKSSSMIKDMSNNTIFYIEHIDQKQFHYIGWQLPITRKSIQRLINFSPDLTPISSMPFSPELFPEYDLLIPYFKKAIEGNFSSNRDDALDFFVLSSFMIYLNDKYFLRTFINELYSNDFQFQIESIAFDSYAKEFISILKMHLADHSIGFSMNQTNHPLFLHCSPAHISSNKNYRVTGNEIKCLNGTHVLISTRLSLKHPTYLELSVQSPAQFNVGVHSFTPNQSISATYLFSYKSKQIIYNSFVVKTVQMSSNISNLIISFNPAKRKAAFFDSSSTKIHSAVLPSDKCCFIIQTFDPVSIKYHISYVPLTNCSISDSNAQFLCPISGKTVFKRTNIFKQMKGSLTKNKVEKPKGKSKKNKFVSPLKDVPFDDIIKASKIVSTKPAELDTNIFSMSFVQMDEEPIFKFTNDLVSSPFVLYPFHIIKECGHSLNTKRHKDEQIQQPTFASIKYERISNCAIKTPTVSYYEVDSSISPITYRFESMNDAVYIDDNTGEVELIDKTKLHPVNYLQPFHPNNYPVMPTDILNLYATGYVSKFRNKVKNQILLQLIASPSILNSSASAPSSVPPSGFTNSISTMPSSVAIANLANSMDCIFDIFEFSLQNVIEYSISLMLFLEPVHVKLVNEKKSPVNFDFNILDRNQMASSTKYIHKAALNNILLYFSARNQAATVLDIWFNYLKHQFSDIQNHFIAQKHPSAVIFPLAALTVPKYISIPGASSLLVFKTGFSRETPVIAQVQVSEITRNQASKAKSNSNESNISLQPSEATQNNETNISLAEIASSHYLTVGVDKPIPISSNIALISGDSLDLTPVKIIDGVSIVILPIFSSSNESLFGTFFQLIISFKYFVYYLSQHIEEIDNNKIHSYRAKLYQLYIDSFIAESPFFYYFGEDVLEFLRTTLPTSGSDFTDDMPVKLSLLALYTDVKKYPFIGQFLEEQQMMWDERMLLPLKELFPEFLTEADKREIAQIPKEEKKTWGLPQPPLPQELSLSNDNDCSQLGGQLKRMMKPRTSIIGYPFHLLIHLWCHYASLYPPFEKKIISDTVCQIKFTFYVPKAVEFLCGASPAPLLRYSSNKDMSDALEIAPSQPTHLSVQKSEMSMIIVNSDNCLYLELTSGNTWKDFQFALMASSEGQTEDFIKEYRNQFVDDVNLLVLHWDIRNDEKILSCFPVQRFSDTTISLEIPPVFLLHSEFPLPLHLLTIRATLLFALNWTLYYDKISFENDPSLKCLCQSMSMSLRMGRFRHLIEQQSNDDPNEIQINRREAYEIRTGTSDDLKMTIIAQLTRCYKDPRAFRRRGDKPWRVTLMGESGIDAGGPARELVSEAAKDLVSPFCGLFIQVPNGRNDVGSNRDSVIPIADPRHTNALEQYKFAGVLIGICIRSGIVQDLNIAPFVWEYLASGSLTIEDIFAIDENYRVLIESLMEAIKSEIDETTFESKFNLRFVIYDSRGQEVPLTQRGRVEKVTFANCSEFISLANEFRLGEMRQNLEAMRNGLWENLDFKPPSFTTGEMLEFSACGNKEITYEAMKKIIRFESVSSDQQEYFLRVLQAMTSEQRSELLKFSTGRVRLPAQSSGEMTLHVDRANGVRDRLPTASTCFNQFHMPQYSSFDKALKMITVAIEYTGTFENR